MVQVVAGDVVEVSIQGEFDNTEDVVNVFHMKCLETFEYTEEGWADEILELVDAILYFQKVCVSLKTTWNRVRARFVNKADSGRLIELDTPIDGVASGDPSPSGVALLAGFRTARPKTLLKKYLGTVSETHIDTVGGVTPAGVAAVVAFVDDMIAGHSTTWQEWEYGHYDTDLATWIPITSGYASAEPAYQRRRRRGHGQ